MARVITALAFPAVAVDLAVAAGQRHAAEVAVPGRWLLVISSTVLRPSTRTPSRSPPLSSISQKRR